MRDAPDRWNGSHWDASDPAGGWLMACGPSGPLGWAPIMAMLPNSTTGGLQWSERWQQPYFTVPPGVYTPDNSTETTIWIDDARSLAPKYQLSVTKFAGIGVWALEGAPITVGFQGANLSYAAAGRAMWAAIPDPWARA